MHRLADLITTRRHELKLTAISVARAAGVTRSYLSMIENSKVAHPPSEAVLQRLQLALQLDNNELLDAAAWERTPDSIRQQLDHTQQQVQLSKKLADWLRNNTDKQNTRLGARDLDALFASGELTKRIAQILTHSNTSATYNREQSRSSKSSQPATSPPHNHSDDEPPLLQHLVSATLPLINLVPAGTPTDFTDLDYPARIADDYLPRPADIDDPDAFAARIVGQSMVPDYQPNDLVVFSPQAETPDGCDCFVRLEPEHHVTFKRIFFEDEGNIIRLVPINPNYKTQRVPREQIAGLYRAVWKMQRLT